MGDAVDRDRSLEGVRALKQDPDGSEMIWSGDVEAIIRYAPAVRGNGGQETSSDPPSAAHLPQRGRLLEARVLGLEEYRAIAEKPRDEREPVWEEWRDAEGCWKVPERAYEGYGTAWRCWTDKPTDEQRGKAKWG